MDVSPRFGERLLMARRRANLEQDVLARRTGITRYTLGRLERGQTTQIDIAVLPRLAKELGVTTDWLLGMDLLDDPSTNELTEEAILVP